jgi:hypothetical protein
VQNPKDHWYASPTGRAEDCPQPDWGLLPGDPETPTGSPESGAHDRTQAALEAAALLKSRAHHLEATAGLARRASRADADHAEMVDATR